MIYIFQVHTHPQGKIIKFKTSQLPTQLKTIKPPNVFKYELKAYLINKLSTK